MPPNPSDQVFAMLQDLEAVDNSHNQGTKRVFVDHQMVQTQLTQFAHGALTPGQESGFHAHATMEEYFYFISGQGTFTINDVAYKVNAKSFIRVPSKQTHNLSNTSDGLLEFVYFGIAM